MTIKSFGLVFHLITFSKIHWNIFYLVECSFSLDLCVVLKNGRISHQELAFGIMASVPAALLFLQTLPEEYYRAFLQRTFSLVLFEFILNSSNYIQDQHQLEHKTRGVFPHRTESYAISERNAGVMVERDLLEALNLIPL